MSTRSGVYLHTPGDDQGDHGNNEDEGVQGVVRVHKAKNVLRSSVAKKKKQQGKKEKPQKVEQEEEEEVEEGEDQSKEQGSGEEETKALSPDPEKESEKKEGAEEKKEGAEEEEELPSEEMMNERDDVGWAPIHHAAFRGFLKSVDRFVKASSEQLELETADDSCSTPLLLAVMGGDLETVQLLVEREAKVSAINSHNHGVVELCAFKQYLDILKYFVGVDDPRLPVWKLLVKFLSTEVDEETEAAAKCIGKMIEPLPDGVDNPTWRQAYDNGIVTTVVKVMRSSVSDDAKVDTLEMLHHMLPEMEVKDQISSSGGIPVLVRLLKGPGDQIVKMAARTLKELFSVSRYADQAAQNGVIPALIKALQTVKDAVVRAEVADALGNLTEAGVQHQQSVCTTQGAIQCIVSQYDTMSKPLLLALTQAVKKTAQGHPDNQVALVNEGVAKHIVMLTRDKSRDLQQAAVEAVYSLAHENPQTQRSMMGQHLVRPLMALLRKSRQPPLQELTARALWALAGDSLEERRTMAAAMSVPKLIEFVSSLSEELHFIGSEGLGVLSQGAVSQHGEIAEAGGVYPLVRQLRSDKEHIVLSVIRTLRYLCVGVGYVPHHKNQSTISQARGVKYLVGIMVHSRDELLQVEAAHTLGCAALGNTDILEEIKQNLDFSYVRILRLMYAKDDQVRLLAASALAAFAYNSLQNQRDIASQGGVRFNCFVPFLQSSDEFFRCHAAFQVVVLAKIIPDEEQAISSAAGIKLLVDLLEDSRSSIILSLAADCVARLAHTRAGVPAAFVSIGAVELLSRMLMSPSQQVQGCAAIGLAYLSHNHEANRALLRMCRQKPALKYIIGRYTKDQLSTDFVEGWKHSKKVGLPRIDPGEVSLIRRNQEQYDGTPTEDTTRPLTVTSMGEAADVTNSSCSQAHDTGSRAGSRDGSRQGSHETGLTPRQSDLSSRGSSRGSICSSSVMSQRHEITAGD